MASEFTNVVGWVPLKKYYILYYITILYLNFCKMSLQQNQSYFFLRSYGTFTAIKQSCTKWLPHAQLDQTWEKNRHQNKNYRALDLFSLAIVCRWKSEKVEINFWQTNFSLEIHSVGHMISVARVCITYFDWPVVPNLLVVSFGNCWRIT